MSFCHRSEKMIILATFKPVVIYQASGNTTWASGLVVMTSRLQRGDRLFNSGLAHSYLKLKNGKFKMVEKILFSLENCTKCTQTKELLIDRNDIKIVTFPHNINDWSDEQLNDAKSHSVYEDLLLTAPILWADGKKTVGYLRIRKWLQDNK